MDENIFMKQHYLKAVFDMFDKDNSGKIDIEEVKKILQGEEVDIYVS